MQSSFALLLSVLNLEYRIADLLISSSTTQQLTTLIAHLAQFDPFATIVNTMESLGIVIPLSPDGDVTFEVGPDGNIVFVRVSSEVMRSASVVFSGMLGPNFAEGQGLGLMRNPKPIRLPDDDGNAFVLLCSVIYGRHIQPTVEQLKAVAGLNDKYMTAEAIKPWSRKWSERLEGDIGS